MCLKYFHVLSRLHKIVMKFYARSIHPRSTSPEIISEIIKIISRSGRDLAYKDFKKSIYIYVFFLIFRPDREDHYRWYFVLGSVSLKSYPQTRQSQQLYMVRVHHDSVDRHVEQLDSPINNVWRVVIMCLKILKPFLICCLFFSFRAISLSVLPFRDLVKDRSEHTRFQKTFFVTLTLRRSRYATMIFLCCAFTFSCKKREESFGAFLSLLRSVSSTSSK